MGGVIGMFVDLSLIDVMIKSVRLPLYPSGMRPLRKVSVIGDHKRVRALTLTGILIKYLQHPVTGMGLLSKKM